MRTIDRLLPKAEKALLERKIVNQDTKTAIKGKAAAIAGFGAMVITMGLLPTMAVYKANHRDIAEALEDVTGHRFDNLMENRGNNNEMRRFTEQFMQASVALKLMIRTYIIPKEND